MAAKGIDSTDPGRRRAMIVLALLLADSGWDNHMGDWGAGWWIVMMLMMVAFWALVIVGVVGWAAR